MGERDRMSIKEFPYRMKENRTFRPVPGLSREDEEKQLAEIIGIAQENLERISRRGGQLREELHDLM